MNPKSWVLSQAVGWFGGQWRSWPKCFGTKFADNARPKQAVQSSTKKSFKCLWRSFGLYKIVPKRPEMSSGCYKSQSFFFPKTSKNPIQPGNPKLNDTSFTPDEFARAKKIKSKCSQPKYFWEEKGLRLITAKLQFMVFQKYCSEKSEMHYWYIIHDIKEISEKILKFQQCVPSQSPTNHPNYCHLIYQCLCTQKKITPVPGLFSVLNFLPDRFGDFFGTKFSLRPVPRLFSVPKNFETGSDTIKKN